MKAFVTIFLVGLLSTWSSLVAAEQTRTFTIEKMTCAVCPITVKKAMEQVDGVTSVDVDFETKTATVTFDELISTATDVAQASTNAGYPAKEIE